MEYSTLDILLLCLLTPLIGTVLWAIVSFGGTYLFLHLLAKDLWKK